jgi:hypothetical protein
MKGKIFRGKRLLYFDSSRTIYTTAIKDSFEKQGGVCDFYTFFDPSFYDKILNNFSSKWLKGIRFKRMKTIIDSIKNTKYDIILIKSPFMINFEFFDKLNAIFPDVPKINYNWSSVQKFNFLPYRGYFDKVISFDPVDAKEHNLDYYPLFYISEFKDGKNLENTNNRMEYDVSFIGSAYSEGRYEFLQLFKIYSEYNDIKTFYYLYSGRYNHLKRKLIGEGFPNVKHKLLQLESVISIFAQSRAIIDYPMDIQNGLTIRTFEALGMGKKLITTNKNILNEPFFDDKHIHVVDADLKNFDKGFLYADLDYDLPIVQNYYIDNWLTEILAI